MPYPLTQPMDIRIHLNGRPHDLPAGHSVARLIADLGLAPEGIAVERNQALVARERAVETILCEGDRVEIVTLVGGG